MEVTATGWDGGSRGGGGGGEGKRSVKLEYKSQSRNVCVWMGGSGVG